MRASTGAGRGIPADFLLTWGRADCVWTASPDPEELDMQRIPIRCALAVAACLPALAQAANVFTSDLSFQTSDQSLWGSGGAFQFDYQKFLGVDSGLQQWTINPAAVSGSVDLPFPIPDFDYTVDPYLLFATDLRVGMDVGASLNGGSIDAKLDYAVTLQAPDRIVKGQAFTLTGLASQLGSSAFSTQAPTAEAYVDGILDVYFGGYMRFTTGQDFGNHDYRMGNKGFTDNNTSNVPFRTLADVNLSPEIVSFNRDGNGQLKVLGQSIGGVGSQYEAGSTTITAGDWRVNPDGKLQGTRVSGRDETTLLTATLDVDQLATGGAPVLGTGIEHDWGVIEVDIGYELVDLETSLSMGLAQDLSLDADLLVRLSFSEMVLIDGVEATEFVGDLAALPSITLLGDSVMVTPEFLVEAMLDNQTGLTFAAGAALTVMEAHAKATYDVTYFGFDQRGTFFNEQLGPFYEWDTTLPLGEINIYDQQFALAGFQAIAGASFLLAAVPEPATYALWLAGLGMTGFVGRRRRQRAV